MLPLSYPIGLACVLFLLGVVGFFVRRTLITVFMAVELMLNAANLLFVAFAKMHGEIEGHLMVLFVMGVAAAEAAVGLAIMIYYIRRSSTKNGLVEDLI